MEGHVKRHTGDLPGYPAILFHFTRFNRQGPQWRSEFEHCLAILPSRFA